VEEQGRPRRRHGILGGTGELPAAASDGAPSSLLLTASLSSLLLVAMARARTRQTPSGAAQAVAHTLECALFGASGMGTGHPVSFGGTPVQRFGALPAYCMSRTVAGSAPSATSLSVDRLRRNQGMS
jgi:hypothetical protein